MRKHKSRLGSWCHENTIQPGASVSRGLSVCLELMYEPQGWAQMDRTMRKPPRVLHYKMKEAVAW